MQRDEAAPGSGHNAPGARQWQTPHLPGGQGGGKPAPREPDLDLVETAFVDGFLETKDATSFLRLARIPFVTERNGARLELIRVEIDSMTDVASVTPGFGGAGHRVAPLPEGLISRRRTLAFVYLGADGAHHLDLAAVRALPDLTPPA
jgi:hypothetical protein